MNEQIRSILAQETTKTSKIRQLYLLGVPRAEIARMVTNGNYGFVVNALRRMSECECGPNIQPLAAAPDYTFNRKFGIEIEAYNCSRERLARELRESGIEVVVEGYNHTTRPHWKLVTDSSLNGNDTFELVSPILVGEAGLRELEKVCWVLELCDVKVNGSCGLHVHIDAAGFSMETFGLVDIEYRIIAQQGQQLVSLFLLVGQTGVFLVWHAFSVFLVFGNGVQIPEINRKRFFAFLHVDFFILRLLVG